MEVLPDRSRFSCESPDLSSDVNRRRRGIDGEDAFVLLVGPKSSCHDGGLSLSSRPSSVGVGELGRHTIPGLSVGGDGICGKGNPLGIVVVEGVRRVSRLESESVNSRPAGTVSLGGPSGPIGGISWMISSFCGFAYSASLDERCMRPFFPGIHADTTRHGGVTSRPSPL